MSKYLLIALLSFNINAMQNCKTIPLAGEGAFSPAGKHLVVCEEKKISVYDAISGIIRGTLPALPASYDSHSLPSHYKFSPKGTYFYATYKGKLWNLAELKEHLPHILASRQVELWNEQETVFLSAPLVENDPRKKKLAPANIWHAHNAVDGTVIHSIDHRERIPSSPRISPNGKLLAFIYKMQLGNGEEGSTALITNLEQRTHTVLADQRMSDVHQIEFCPDNEHALISTHADQIMVMDCKKQQPNYFFTCASTTSGYLLNSEGRFIHTENACSITSNGFISNINNRLNRKEKYYITQNEQKKHTFTCTKLSKTKAPEKITPSLSKNLAIIQKNKKIGSYGNAIYDIFLQKKEGNQIQHTCLVPEVYKVPTNVRFAGSHDEQLIIIDPLENILHIFDPYSGQELGKIAYKEFRISPRGHSFITKVNEKDEQTQERVDRWYWYILPSAAEILREEKNTYFSLLPPDVTTLIKRFET